MMTTDLDLVTVTSSQGPASDVVDRTHTTCTTHATEWGDTFTTSYRGASKYYNHHVFGGNQKKMKSQTTNK